MSISVNMGRSFRRRRKLNCLRAALLSAIAMVSGALAQLANQASAREPAQQTANTTGQSGGIGAASPSAQETERNRASMEGFVELFYRQRKVREAFETYVSENSYIQHNPNMRDGRETAITMLEPKFTAPGFHAEVQRIVVDGPLAVVHVAVGMRPGQYTAAVADIYRFEGGKIVEHWDVLQTIPDNPKSKHPMF